jgi:hypothetical protein
MSRAGEIAYRLRGLLLAAGVLHTLLGLTFVVLPFFDVRSYVHAIFGETQNDQAWGLMLTPFTFGTYQAYDEWGYARDALLVLGTLLIAQWGFLRPRHGWTARLTTVARPLKTAVVSAALMAMLLSIGLGSLVLEIPGWWMAFLEYGSDNGSGATWGMIGVWGAMLFLWAFWACVFFVYWRQGDRYTQLGKMIRGLVAGSLLEFFVAIPAHVWATRQRGCYCATGTYTTLVFAGTVLLWAFGPGICLLYWREKYRREKLLSAWEGGPERLPEVGK